jgi:hypothetical protein
MAKTVVDRRTEPETGELRAVGVPDHVDVLCQMQCEAQAHMVFSAATGGFPACLWGGIWCFRLVPRAEMWCGSASVRRRAGGARPPWSGLHGFLPCTFVHVQLKAPQHSLHTLKALETLPTQLIKGHPGDTAPPRSLPDLGLGDTKK